MDHTKKQNPGTYTKFLRGISGKTRIGGMLLTEINELMKYKIETCPFKNEISSI